MPSSVQPLQFQLSARVEGTERARMKVGMENFIAVDFGMRRVGMLYICGRLRVGWA